MQLRLLLIPVILLLLSPLASANFADITELDTRVNANPYIQYSGGGDGFEPPK